MRNKKFDKAMVKLMKIEGIKYTNRKDDSGGKTKYGITEGTARLYGFTRDMRTLHYSEAREIYKKMYWDKMKLDEIVKMDFKVAFELFEEGVNFGTYRAQKNLQEVLNVFNRYGKDWEDLEVDGKIGQATLRNLKKAIRKRKKNILKGLNVVQGSWYIQISKNPKRRNEMNINGWFSKRVSL